MQHGYIMLQMLHAARGKNNLKKVLAMPDCTGM